MQKQIIFTLCYLNGKKQRERINTPSGHVWTAKGIENLLTAQCEYVTNAFPGREFRLVPLRDGNFNFVEIEPEGTDQVAVSA